MLLVAGWCINIATLQREFLPTHYISTQGCWAEFRVAAGALLCGLLRAAAAAAGCCCCCWLVARVACCCSLLLLLPPSDFALILATNLAHAVHVPSRARWYSACKEPSRTPPTTRHGFCDPGATIVAATDGADALRCPGVACLGTVAAEGSCERGAAALVADAVGGGHADSGFCSHGDVLVDLVDLVDGHADSGVCTAAAFLDGEPTAAAGTDDAQIAVVMTAARPDNATAT